VSNILTNLYTYLFVRVSVSRVHLQLQIGLLKQCCREAFVAKAIRRWKRE